MDTDLASIDVATHWLWLRSILDLDRHWAIHRVTMALAMAQVDAEGKPVTFGSAMWAENDLTAGEAGAARRALNVLERRGVVAKWDGSGRRGNAWTFVPSIRHWRSMPWRTSARDAHLVVGACACRAPCPVVALLPGQSGALSRTDYQIRIPEHMHLRRPAVSPVDMRDYRARCATTARPPGETPVDMRDKSPEFGAHTVLSKELTFLIGGTEERNRFAKLTKATDELDPDPGHYVKPGTAPERRLRRVAAKLTDRQVDVLLSELAQCDPGPLGHFIPKTAELIEDMASGNQAVVLAGRGHPAGVDLPDEIQALADSFRA